MLRNQPRMDPDQHPKTASPFGVTCVKKLLQQMVISSNICKYTRANIVITVRHVERVLTIVLTLRSICELTRD